MAGQWAPDLGTLANASGKCLLSGLNRSAVAAVAAVPLVQGVQRRTALPFWTGGDCCCRFRRYC